MKICSSCKKEKNLLEFNKKSGKKSHQPFCRLCDNERSKRYYAENKKHHISVIKERNQRYKKEVDKWVRDLKSNTSCADCKKTYHWFQMDFDHVKGNKDRAVSTMIAQKVSLRRIQLEIEKCELVCANCYRLRTYKSQFTNE
jgi:hypothetical protein